MSDGRVKYPEAVEAAKKLRTLCSQVMVRMRTDGIFGLPSDAEWRELYRLVDDTLRGLPLSAKGTKWRKFQRVEGRYPNVHLKAFVEQVIGVLKQNPAPVDKLRLTYWERIRRASATDLGNLDCDVGLVQWILERGQWQAEATWNLSDAQWREIDRIVRPHVLNVPDLLTAPGAAGLSYKEVQLAKAENGRTCLRELIRSSGQCRGQIGAVFSLQLGYLWGLGADWVHETLRAFTHVSGGQAKYEHPDRSGRYFEDGRIPTPHDHAVEKKRRQTAKRVRRYRAKKQGA